MVPKSMLINSRKKLVFLILVLGCVLLSFTSASPVFGDSVTDRIRANMEGKKIGLYEPVYGMPISSSVKAGQTVLLAINVQDLDSIGNCITTYHGIYRDITQLNRFITIKPDPTLPEKDGNGQTIFVPASSFNDPLIIKTLQFPDCQLDDETGIIHFQMDYKLPGHIATYYTFKYYNYIDDTTDQAYIFSSSPNPQETINVDVGYIGTARTDNEINTLINEYAAHFYYATKKLGALNITYLGRHYFPDDNALVAGKIHNYSQWWNSVPHNLTGTDLLPLNINNPDDFEMIKLAWYSEPENKSQFFQDLTELFSFPQYSGQKLVILAEAPGGVSSGASFATVAYYNFWPFKEMVNGVYQYGIHKDFGPVTSEGELKVTLHEFGHIRGLAHPPLIYQPSPTNWEVRYALDGIEKYSNVMHTGVLEAGQYQGYPTDLFYTDADIWHLLAQSTPTENMPTVNPIGEIMNHDLITLSGTKQAGYGIMINNVEVLPVNSSTTWSYQVYLSQEINRFDVSQFADGKISHPRIIYLKLTEESLPSLPEVTFTTNVSSVNAGGIIGVSLSGKATDGLTGIWWWVEKLVEGQYQYLSGVGRWHDIYGAVKKDLFDKVSFEEPGTYRLSARARDIFYHQSDIVTVTVVVQNAP